MFAKIKSFLTIMLLVSSLGFVAYSVWDYKTRPGVDINSAITVESGNESGQTIAHCWPDSTVVKFIKGAVSEWIKDCESHGISTEKVRKMPIKIKTVTQMPERIFTSTDQALGMLDVYDRTIYVLKGKWDPIVYRVIVYHELGHYMWNVNHTPTAGEVMFDSIDTDSTSASIYKANWNKLVENYFKYVTGKRDEIEII